MTPLEIAQARAMATPGPSRASRASRARGLLRLLGTVVAFAGCSSFGQLDPRAQRATDVFECYVASVAPYVGDACDVAELVQDAVRGRVDLLRALALLGSTRADLESVASAMNACKGEQLLAPPVNPRTLALSEH